MGVSGWYCQCKVGARVVGCCAHIASVMWYLAHHRHKTEAQKTKRLSDEYGSFLQDSATVAPNEWSDGEDEEPDREATDEDATGEE